MTQVDRIAGLLAVEVALQAGDDVAVAVQVDERLAFRAVNHHSVVALEYIIDRYDTIFLDNHDCLP